MPITCGAHRIWSPVAAVADGTPVAWAASGALYPTRVPTRPPPSSRAERVPRTPGYRRSVRDRTVLCFGWGGMPPRSTVLITTPSLQKLCHTPLRVPSVRAETQVCSYESIIGERETGTARTGVARCQLQHSAPWLVQCTYTDCSTVAARLTTERQPERPGCLQSRLPGLAALGEPPACNAKYT